MDKEFIRLLADLTKDIEQLKQELKQDPNINTSRISAKDVLLYILPIIAAHDHRLTTIETRWRIGKYILPIAVTLCGIGIALISTL